MLGQVTIYPTQEKELLLTFHMYFPYLDTFNRTGNGFSTKFGIIMTIFQKILVLPLLVLHWWWEARGLLGKIIIETPCRLNMSC
jgi:hypothetical protein